MTGVGHTRWATHGGPSQQNAHPHCDCRGNIIVVHNGIILNFERLKQQLTDEGHKFISETDTEVIPHLIEKYYNGNLEKAVETALCDVKGTYALIALIKGESKLVTARKENPLIIGIGDRENFIASDAPAILDYTDRVIYLEDSVIGIITADSIRIKRNGSEVNLQEHKLLWNVEDAQKAGYEHFMLKEIHEQPKVIRDTIGEYSQTLEKITEIDKMRETGIESMLILACGSSYHSGLIGKYIIEKLLEIPVRTELASEFNYYGQTLAQTIAIVITQSGETADTIKTIKRLQEVGCRVLVITNVVGSSASRIANQTVYTRAGPEMSVAATKSFMAQLMALYWLAMSYSKADVRELADMLMRIRQLPSKVQQVLDDENTIRKESKRLAKYQNVLFVGRGINFPVALEGALKLKEISYIHAEGFAAGELKHGPFALLDNNTPIIAIVVKDNTYDAMLTNIKEIKARGSPLIALAEEGDEYIHSIADSVITVPQVGAMFSPVVNTVTLQLLAYYTAKEKGNPVDFPRNLAKSVTVE
jgi:glucosamine--fructose-6-phosphate aminotransferase (isomerizing)